MASLNKVHLLGFTGRDPEVRYLPSGKAVATISLATSSKRKDKNTGEVTEETQWHRLNFFDRLAEICGEYVKKGSQIYIEGRLKYGKYTDKDGIERNTADVLVTEMQLLGSRDAAAPRQAPKTEQPQAAPAAAPRAPSSPSHAGSGFEDLDDDLPF
jgi:single-strand DNA-binding protein